MANYVYSVSDASGNEYGIIWDTFGFCVTVPGVTAAKTIETYATDVDGLSIAICRAHYLARKSERGFTKEAVKRASEIFALGRRKAHEKWLNA